MKIEVKLPDIDTATKSRITDYFAKAAKKGQVILDIAHDNLPPEIKEVKTLNFYPDSKKPEDTFIDLERIVVNVVIYKEHEPASMTVVMVKQVNKNAQGIPCGVCQETLSFSAENIGWLEGLATI